MPSTLYENCLLTRPACDKEVQAGAWFVVEDERFARCGEGPAPPEIGAGADRRIDLEGRRVVPGFINAHSRLYGSLFPRLPWPRQRPGLHAELLESTWWRFDRALDERALRVSARLGLAEALRHGCTTLVDLHSSPGIEEGATAILAEEAVGLGLKLAMSVELSDRNGEEAMEDALDENLRAIQNYAGHASLRGVFGLQASCGVSDETLDRLLEVLPFETPFHLHCAEDPEDAAHARAEGYESPVDRLAAMGLLRPGTVLAHVVHLSPGDAELIREMGAYAVHCPRANAHRRVGTADVGAMLGSGVKVCLGTDDFLGGMLTEAQFARDTGVSHGTLVPGRVGELLFLHNPSLASSLFGRPIGRLAEGEDADFVVMEPTEHLLDPEARILRVVSRGRTVAESGEIMDLDMANLRREADDEAKRVWKRIAAL